MADYGLKISINGSDVKTAANKDLVFTSSANTLKLQNQGSQTLNVGLGVATASVVCVTHNLGYRPWAQTFTSIFSKRYNTTNFIRTQPDFPAGLTPFLWTDITTTQIILRIDFDIFTSPAAYAFNVYWYYAVDTGQN